MDRLPPLRFRPVFKRYLWGGRRLGSLLGKAIGDGEDYAESWEIADHPAGQSVVDDGPWQNRSLHDLVVERPRQLLGPHQQLDRFPLLFKFLDCQQQLSVQVHPDDQQAARLQTPDLGKTEAWVVLAAEPGSVVYAGLKRGFDREAFRRELMRGTCELCLHRVEAKPGDCLFIPAGTVHALGAGLVVAEIQQASDTTFRLFDWNRVGPDGSPRPLHIEAALEVIDYERGPISIQATQQTACPHVERLVACEKFVLDRWRFAATETIGGDDRLHLVSLLEGELHLASETRSLSLASGSTVLLPASAGSARLAPKCPCVLLDIYLP